MRRAALSAFSLLALAGCAPLDIHPPSPTPLARAQATHEYPGPPGPAQNVAGSGAATAVQAIDAFANTYVNWTSHTLVAQLRALAADSVGQARAAMSLAAAQAAGDYELQRGGVANSGQVEAVAPLAGGHDQYVVVTREQTTASNPSAYQGLAPAWHVALATVVTLRPGEWVLSGWQPES